MRARTDLFTWHLTTVPVEIISDRKARIALRTVLVTVLVFLAVLAGLRMYAEAAGPAARMAALQERNAALGAELERLQAELALERATRAALEQQVTALNSQASELASQLNFFNAQSGRPRAGHSRD
jgi:septal ring factor EnvC (AmiA/AmiB activator)